MKVQFEDPPQNLPGFWDPSDSTIDWCERNYVFSFYIAELWNTISSLALCWVGISCFMALRSNEPLRIKLICFGNFMVGAGSVLFHASLTYWGQLLDEIPMFMAMFQTLACIADITDKKSDLPLAAVSWWLPFIGLVLSFMHAVHGFTTLFQATFGVLVVGVLSSYYMYAYPPWKSDRHDDWAKSHNISSLDLQKMLYPNLFCVLSAFVLWVVDCVLCHFLQNHLPFYPPLHAAWHVLMAIACRYGILTVAFLDREAGPKKLEWWGLWPVLKYVDKKEKSQ